MSRIDDLLEEHCPEGVEVKPLGQVGQFIRGNGLQKKDFVEEGIGCIHYGQIYTHYGTSATETKSFVSPELAAKLRSARPGDLVVTTTSENVEDVGKAVAWLGEGLIAIGGHSCSFTHSLDPLYAAYYFQTDAFHRQKRRFVKGTKVKELATHDLARIQIPVPPMVIQREIVSILTRMEALEAELEAELEARRRQYAHYRDALLSFDSLSLSNSEVRWMTLADLAEFTYGFTATAQDQGKYRFIRITDIDASGKLSPVGAKYVGESDEVDAYVVAPGDVLMARTGATYGKSMLAPPGEPSVFASFLIRIRFPSGKVLPEYYWHFAQSGSYWAQANSMVSTGGQPQFNANALKRVVMPVPPISEQVRLVALLGAFDVLVADLSSGLPAEIAARRQQYEYYRDRLFDFERLAA